MLSLLDRVLILSLLVGSCAAAPLNPRPFTYDDMPFNYQKERLHFSKTLRDTHRAVESKYSSMLLKHTYESLKRDPTIHPNMKAPKKVTDQEKKLRHTSVKNLLLSTDRAIKGMSQRAAAIHQGAKTLLKHASYDMKKAMTKAVVDHKARKAQRDLKKKDPRMPLKASEDKEHSLHARVKSLTETFSGQCKHSQQTNRNEISRIQKVLKILSLSKKKAHTDLEKMSNAANKAIEKFAACRKRVRNASLQVGPGLDKLDNLVRTNQSSKDQKAAKGRLKQLASELRVAHASVEESLQTMGAAKSKVKTVSSNIKQHLAVRMQILAHQRQTRMVCRLPAGISGDDPAAVKAIQSDSTPKHQSVAEMLQETKHFTSVSVSAAETMMHDAKAALHNTAVHLPVEPLVSQAENPTTVEGNPTKVAADTMTVALKPANPLVDLNIKLKVCATAKLGLEEICKLHGKESQQCAQSEDAYKIQCGQ